MKVLFDHRVFHAFDGKALDVVNVALPIAAVSAVGVFGVHIEKLEAAFGVGLLVGLAGALGGGAMARVVDAELGHREAFKRQLAAALGATGLANPLLVAGAAALALGRDASEGEGNELAGLHGVQQRENVVGVDVGGGLDGDAIDSHVVLLLCWGAGGKREPSARPA